MPVAGSPGDPTLGGATLTLYRGDGGQGMVALALPAPRWTRVGTTYRYRDMQRVDGPITAVTLRTNRLVVRGKGVGLYQLDGAPQGAVALRLRLGTAVELCAAAPAAAPPSANDTTAKFFGTKNSPPPATCPPVPTPGG